MRTSADAADPAETHTAAHPTPGPGDETRRLGEWRRAVADQAVSRLGQREGGELVSRWLGGLSLGYSAVVRPETVVEDLVHAEAVLADPDQALPVVELRSTSHGDSSDELDAEDHWRLRLYRPGPATLSRVLPLVADLGVEVTDERPYLLRRVDGRRVWLYDLGLAMSAAVDDEAGDPRSAAGRLADAFAAAWADHTESDPLSRLVLVTGMTWPQVAVLRALVQYLRQTGLPHTPEYVARTLSEHPDAARRLVELFEARTLPAELGGPLDRDTAVRVARTAMQAIVDEVAGRDTDRILRSLWSVVDAILRTNAHARGPGGTRRPTLAFKIDTRQVLGVPAPCPTYEIWVHSPRVEGVHLRFGAVARGGLRWSDRVEDFRTEVLGLVKAQVVKNAVIVPSGAKGGFVAKRWADPEVDRDAWWDEGIACYRDFIGGILDLTDNLHVEGGRPVVVPPPHTVRHDGDDPYLVVAADKGTATFSDIANGIALERGFWLGDAFASGGSNGYDHKAMGITARGAWESVRRHFRELGTDPQDDTVTVVGIGDMSGDVFGNGMLLSKHLRLVAAFDHRHVFLDPNPDPAASYAERKRLFGLDRSSWGDYDRSLISPGGGVHPRSAKTVTISAEVAARLGLPGGTTRLEPDDLVRAIVSAPVDLLWNGGIGTYVKAADEQHLDVGDRANDGVRVDARDLRVRVIGEGGNLGLTQRGRVEAAACGIRLNNDAVDNSAGVDCSDHEVNIKIALDRAVADGALGQAERTAVLHRLTEEVAELVLANNRSQNEALSDEGILAPAHLPAHRELVDALERAGQVDRVLEVLPGDGELDRRARDGLGLTVPELSVLLAHAKISLAGELLGGEITDDDWVLPLFHHYFPREVRERLGDRLDQHPLRRDIAATVLVNAVIDRGGITVVHRAIEETGRSAQDVVRAAAVVSAVFDLPGLAQDVRALDGQVPATVQTAMRQEQRRLVDRAVRWLLRGREPIDVLAEIRRFAPAVEQLGPRIPGMLVGQDREYVEALAASYSDRGTPPDAALRTARALYVYALLDIVELAEHVARPVEEVAEIWFALSQRYRFDVLLTRISALGRDDIWKVHARSALRFDLYGVHRQFTASVLTASTATPGHRSVEAMIDAWEEQHPAAVARAARMLDDVDTAAHVDLSVLTVALRTLRHVIDHA